MAAEEQAQERPERCPVCGQLDCDGTVCQSQAAVDALLAELQLRTGVGIVAEADAEAQRRLPHAEDEPAAVRIARWFDAQLHGRRDPRVPQRPSCPRCGGWLYVDVDIDDGVELHASGTREIVCLNCSQRWYGWVGSGSDRKRR